MARYRFIPGLKRALSPRLVAVLVSVWTVMTTGCNGHRPSFTRNGSLKAGISQVQFENETLKAKIAKLEKQNRTLLADLDREETYSGTLSARLDESRNLLKNNGVKLPLDEENPSMVARAEESRTNRTTFGQVQPRKAPRRSKYATDETEPTDEKADNEIPENDSPKGGMPNVLTPPGFVDDLTEPGEAPAKVGLKEGSTGWRRLGYRDSRISADPIPENRP